MLRYSIVSGIDCVNGKRLLRASLSRVPKIDMLSLLRCVRLSESFPTATLSTLPCTCTSKDYQIIADKKKNVLHFKLNYLRQKMQ